MCCGAAYTAASCMLNVIGDRCAYASLCLVKSSQRSTNDNLLICHALSYKTPDMSSPTLETFNSQVDGIKILEGLAASGLRSIRYALEVEGTGRVDANDLDADVVDAMKRNIRFNGQEAEQRLRPLQGDARVIMLQNPLVQFCTPVLSLP